MECVFGNGIKVIFTSVVQLYVALILKIGFYRISHVAVRMYTHKLNKASGNGAIG